MPKDLLLVGSVPFETAEHVFKTVGGALAKYLPAMPDGEVGNRQYWVIRQCFQLFNGHPDLETLSRPAPDDGVERLIPRDRADAWSFKVKDGVAQVRFGDPGWRLGYTHDAIASYFIFKTMKDQGLFPKDLRFQVSLPMVNSVVSPSFFPVSGDLDRVRPGYQSALAAEVKMLVDKIPHSELAIQWDCSMEITDVYGGFPSLPAAGAIERNIAQVRALAPLIPSDVMLGYHFCFGTFGGWPRFSPPDLGAAVDLANAFVVASGRRVDWIHIPTLDRTDDAFYAPLQNLKPGGARVYLGCIHSMPTFDERLVVARRHLREFGVAAYCGFGRIPRAEIPGIIADHQSAMARLETMRRTEA